MNAIAWNDSVQLIIPRIAWTLIHSMWQGVGVAAVLVMVLRMLRSAPAQARYLAGCVAMLTFAFACVATFCLMRESRLMIVSDAPDSGVVGRIDITNPIALPLASSRQEINQRANILQWIVLTWIAGVAILSIRHSIGWMLLQRLRRGTHCVRFDPIMNHLKQRLHISGSIALLDTTRIDVPAVIGVFKPVILVPLALLNDLSPRQVEAILAHELAHVRRHDYVINLLQTAVETLMFYHPTIWWISHRIRIERENCCDDIAAAVCGDAGDYAAALAELESRRGPGLAMAATGSDLLGRVRRLLKLPPPSKSIPLRSLAATALMLGCLVLPLLAIDKPAQPKPATSATQPTRFIKIVIGRESIFHDGKRTDWIAVKRMLEAIAPAERRQTVLEVAAASPEVTVHEFFTDSDYASHLVDLYGLAYLSQTGIEPTVEAPLTPQERFDKLRRQLEDAQSQRARLKGTTDETLRAVDQRIKAMKQMLDELATTTQPARSAATAPAAGEYYIDGHVPRTGVYSLNRRGGVTLRQAIEAAGGPEPGFKDARVEVIHRMGADKQEVINLSLDEVLNGRIPDEPVKPNDIIRVGTRAAATPSTPTTVPAPLQAPPGASIPSTDPVTRFSKLSVEQIAAMDVTMREYVHARDAMELNLAQRLRNLGEKHPVVRNAEQDLKLQKARIETYAAEYRKHFVGMYTDPKTGAVVPLTPEMLSKMRNPAGGS